MAPIDQCLASMARLSLSSASRPSAMMLPRFLIPAASQQARFASAPVKKKSGKKKRSLPKEFVTYDIAKSKLPQYSLIDAMRYLRAWEVGRPPQAVKYELSIHLKTTRGGPVIKSRIRLPHPVRSDVQIAVICAEGSKEAEEAMRNGAVLAGLDSVFDVIRQNGDLPFNRLICHEECEAALQKASLGRILGPKGMMPNRKLGTVVPDLRKAMKEIAGADDYRERVGAIRLPIGQLAYTPEMLSDNIKTFVGQVKKECVSFDEQFHKQVHEVVLSSSHGPGFSLNGVFQAGDSEVTSVQLSGVM